MGQNCAATSGRGLTGVQIASAIRMVAETHQKCKCECLAVKNSIGLNGSAHPYAPSSQREDEIESFQPPKEAYEEIFVHHFSIEAKEVEVSEYAPRVFCFFRNVNCVNTNFVDEWTIPREHNQLKLSAGRSKAFFISSKNTLFLSKTIAEEESEALTDILESYIRYILRHPNSFISRFYMLLSIRVGEKVGFVLCTSDVFANVSTLFEKWDIKGRMPKLGQFFYIPHLVPHTYDPNESEAGDSFPEIEANVGPNAAHRKPMNKQDVAPKHDKDLTRMFWIKKENRDNLVAQLLSDYAFLASVNLMDYSLLIGVSCHNSHSRRLDQEGTVENGSSHLQANPGKIALSDVTSLPRDNYGSSKKQPRQCVVSKYEQGILSLLNEEIYFIGIIDVLTRYTVKKKLANFAKSFLWAQKTLSTIPPKSYQHRINKYTQIIFPKVH